MRRFVSLPFPMTVSLALVVACGSLTGAKAWAQPARLGQVVLARSAADDAKVHFDAAKEHYANGQYREAIEQLEIALGIDSEGADLVYNLGVIHEKLQEVDEAILYYQRYVGMIDDGEERERVNKIIVRLENARDELAAGKDAESEGGEGNEVDKPRSKGRMDGWVIGAGVLAGLGLAGGTYFGLEAMKSKNDDPPKTSPDVPYSKLEDNANRAKQMALYADIGFGVAVAAGATAMILYFTRDAEPDVSEEETVAKRVGWEPGVAVLPGGAAASLRIGF